MIEIYRWKILVEVIFISYSFFFPLHFDGQLCISHQPNNEKTYLCAYIWIYIFMN